MATRGRNRDTGPKGISTLYNRYVKQEMERGSTYILDHSVFTKKIQENCVFCGRSPLQRKKGPKIPYHRLVELVRGQVVTDNDLVPCCTKCERWKGQDNYLDFLEHVLKIRDHILRDRDEVANIERSK
jgi:uncharacterized protein (UPF0248 family)